MSEFLPSPTAEVATIEQRLAPITGCLQTLIQENPGYYNEPHKEFDANQRLIETSISEGQYLLGSFEAAQRALAAGNLQAPQRIAVMHGIPSGFDERGKTKQKVLHDAYTQFTSLVSPGTTAVFEDIASTAFNLREHGEIVTRDGGRAKTFETTTSPSNKAALVDGSGRLKGVQLRIDPNMCVNFFLGDFDQEEQHRSLTFVELLATA